MDCRINVFTGLLDDLYIKLSFNFGIGVLRYIKMLEFRFFIYYKV